MEFVTSRSEALDKLNKFIEINIPNYNTKRNFDFGVADRRNVSCLSPYITNRLITEYETTKLVLKKYPFDETLPGKEDRYWAIDRVKEGHKYMYDGFYQKCNHFWTPGGATWKGIG